MLLGRGSGIYCGRAGATIAFGRLGDVSREGGREGSRGGGREDGGDVGRVVTAIGVIGSREVGTN